MEMKRIQLGFISSHLVLVGFHVGYMFPVFLEEPSVWVMLSSIACGFVLFIVYCFAPVTKVKLAEKENTSHDARFIALVGRYSPVIYPTLFFCLALGSLYLGANHDLAGGYRSTFLLIFLGVHTIRRYS